MLRGNLPAKIDDKGRLKVPNAFRALIEQAHGRDVFVTSLTGESVRIYPMPVWLDVERRVAAMPSTHPVRVKFMDRVAFYGQAGELDPQGRLLIQPRLRDSAAMTGEVDVLGKYDHLDVWNHDRFLARLAGDPFTDDDARVLAEFGI
ncbi:MAG: division/cell wall cluster transcriptional repressor MraZ [Vicinamibacteria bacterium]